jgi:hypothetical protein
MVMDLEEAIKWSDDYPDNVTLPLVAEIRRLRSEVEALRKDAERYRWLRDPCSGAEQVFYCRGDYGKGLMSGSTLDAAIDAALAAGRGE